jgi:SpoIID/LytB domain protein
VAVSLCVAVAATTGSVVALVASSVPASAYPSGSVAFEGHGYGHGHGMGQWGALGDALAGTGYQSILDSSYGGTSLTGLTPAQDATQISVVMTENNGNSVIVTSASAFTVGSVSAAAGTAVLMTPAPGGLWDVSQGPSCAGPWPSTIMSDQPSLTAVPGGPALLQLCQAGGSISMHGTIEATYNTGTPASPRTVNTLPLEQYVADVVPSESPAGWGTLGGAGPQGQAWGFQELEAQAVAVRSYVMAGLGSYGDYADTCDLDCQTYRGTLNENALTDQAASDTVGQVMESNGVVAATQYSSSTGGYTNPGAFPAVPDSGDAVCVPGACNPNHTWTASVPVATIESTWPQLGTLQSIQITGRNGYGDWGGRVTAMTLIGSGQKVSLTGDAFAAGVGLKSDWFTTTTSLGAPAVATAATADGGGYWIAGANGAVDAFGDAPYEGSAAGLALVRPIVGMAATPDGAGYWLVASDGGIFSFGDAHFYGSTGAIHLNRPIVGMAATPDGAGYWLVASDGGIFAFGDARFYGSTGSLRLNQPVVGMAPTPDGGGYWLVASDGGIFSFGDARFYGSTGNLHLNKPVVGMAAGPGGQGYWLVASDGGIFSFGTARFHGSTGSLALVEPVVGMARTSDDQGYWLVASDGGLFTFGDASFRGSAAG